MNRKEIIGITIITIISLVGLFVYLIMTRELINREDVVSIEIHGDIYHDSHEFLLNEAEINEFIEILNLPRKSGEGYGSEYKDAEFKAIVTLSDGRVRKFGLTLYGSKPVILSEFDPSESNDFDNIGTWSLRDEFNNQVYDSRILRDFYSTSNPIIPIVYSGDVILEGDHRSNKWEYQTFSGKWNKSNFDQEYESKQNSINENRLKIIYPGHPIEKEYTLYDSSNQIIEKGKLKDNFIDLPLEYDIYTLVLEGTWDYSGSKFLNFVDSSSTPNSYRGGTTSKYSIVRDSNNISKSSTGEHMICLIQLEEFQKLIGKEKVSEQGIVKFDIYTKDIDIMHKKHLEILKISERDLNDIEYFKMKIDGVEIVRYIYKMNEKKYLDAKVIGNDLGLVLKENGEGYVYKINDELYPITYKKTMGDGYINREGQWVIPPIFVRTMPFVNGYSVFSINGNAVDEETINGHIAGAEFSQFSSDMQKAFVDFYTRDVYGLIDKEFNIIIEPKYDYIRYKGGNVAVLEKGSTKEKSLLYLIDEKKEINLESINNAEYVGYFKEGLFAASIQPDNHDSYIDIDGNVVIKGPFRTAREFNNGRAIVGIGDFNVDLKYGVISKSGEVIVPMIFDRISNFNEGIACVSIKTNDLYQYAFIDEFGNLLTDFKYNYASQFKEGRSLVSIGNGKLIYINRDFEPIKNENGETVIVKQSNRIFTIDEDLLTSSYDEHHFSEGYASIEKDGKYGVIDRHGNIVIPCQYRYVEPFINGMAKVKIDPNTYDDQEAYIDTLGRIVVVETYE